MKPIIGISGNFIDNYSVFVSEGVGAKGQEWTVLPIDYSKAIIRAGGIPIILPVDTDNDYIEDIGNLIDGLILSGGEDVDPFLYGDIPDENTGRISHERDENELKLIDYVYNETDKPILAICRGLQILNVYLQGTLIVDIPKEGFHTHSLSITDRHRPVHKITIEEDSLLCEILGNVRGNVNSLHHQGIRTLGKDLVPVARSEEGLIEAVEGKDMKNRFVLGLQWHPEMMSIKDEKQRRIFDYFIKNAIAKSKER